MAGGLLDWRTERVGSIDRIEWKTSLQRRNIAESWGPLAELFGDQYSVGDHLGIPWWLFMELFAALEKFLDMSWGWKERSWESLDCSRVHHLFFWGDFCTLGECIWYEFQVKMMPKTVWNWIL